MALSSNTKIGLGIAAGGLLAVWLASRTSKTPTHKKDFYLPGETARVYQGAPFTIRLPRGTYQSLSSEIGIVTQFPYGNSTDVQVIATPAPNDYVADVIFFDTNNSQNQHSLTVQARKPV